MRRFSKMFAAAVSICGSLSLHAQWVEDTTNQKITTTVDRVGIGTSDPVVSLHVATESASTPRGFMVQQSITSASSAFMVFRKSRGTLASPSVITNGDNLGTLYSEAHDGTGFVRTGAFLKIRVQWHGRHRLHSDRSHPRHRRLRHRQ